MKTLLLALCSLPLFAADPLPLATGNQWIYRVSDGTTRNITVGLPLSAGGRIYYRVTGYASGPALWLRSDATGVFLYDSETEHDVELVRFATGAINTPISGCLQSEEAAKERPAYDGPAGHFEGALELRYRPLGCRDIGFDNEIYLDNLGLAKRVETTFAGPKTMELVFAKVGSVIVEAGKKTTVSLSLDHASVKPILPGDTIDLKATLRVVVADGGALKLKFSTSQRYDLAIRDASGQIVHLWSAAATFLQVTGTENISGQRTWQINSAVSGLQPGNYQVEAWLTTDGARILAAATPFDVLN